MVLATLRSASLPASGPTVTAATAQPLPVADAATTGRIAPRKALTTASGPFAGRCRAIDRAPARHPVPLVVGESPHPDPDFVRPCPASLDLCRTGIGPDGGAAARLPRRDGT